MSETQMFRVYIKATPEAIWDAITSPDWNARYGYKAIVSGGEGKLTDGGGGYPFILSDLKSLLESGKSLQD